MVSVAVIEVFAVVIEDVIFLLNSGGQHALADGFGPVDALVEDQLEVVVFLQILEVGGVFGGEA